MVAALASAGSSAFAPSLYMPSAILLQPPAWHGCALSARDVSTFDSAANGRKCQPRQRARLPAFKMTSTESAESSALAKREGGKDSNMVVITPDFRLSLSVLAFGLYLLKAQASGFGMLFSFIGAFLVLQTIRLRFRFSQESLDVLRVEELSDEGKREDTATTDPAGRNVAIGPWKYSSVVNWEFWWPGFPLVAYFKETQTKATGQRHFFFMIMDGKAVYGEMLKRFGNSDKSKPSLEEWDDLRPLSPKGYMRLRCKIWAALQRLEKKLEIKARLASVLSMLKKVRAEDVSVVFGKFVRLARQYAIRAVRSAKELVAKTPAASAAAPKQDSTTAR